MSWTQNAGARMTSLSTAPRSSLWLAAACLTLGLAACGRNQPAPAAGAAPATATSGPAAVGEAAPVTTTAQPAADPAQAAEPGAQAGVEATAEATDEAAAAPQPAAPEVPAPPADDSIAIHIGTPGSETFALPAPNKVTRVRVTPVDGNGAPIQGLEPLAGGDVVMAALRIDGAWSTLVSASSKIGPASVFDVRFAKPGPHTLLFASRRPGHALHVDQAAVRVQGDWQADDEIATSSSWKQGAWSASLILPPTLNACEDATLEVRWTHRGKAVPAATAPTLLLAVPLANRDRALLGRDVDGAAATTAGRKLVRFDAAEHWSVLALATVGKEQVSATFTVLVAGSVPSGGCPAP